MNVASSLGRDAEHLRALLERVPDVVWTVDSELRIVFVSQAVERVTGFTVEECRQGGVRRCLEHAHPDDRPVLEAAIAALFTGRKPCDVECRVFCKSGELIWARIRADSTYELDGLRCVDGLLTDISDRRRAEAALRESEERLRLALDASRMGIYDWDLLSGHSTWSHWHETLWGFAPGEFDGSYEAFISRVHPDDAPVIAAEIARSHAAHDRYRREYRVVWPDGSVHWIVGLGEFEFDAAGRPVRMRGIVGEITERKRAEHDLRWKTAFLEALVASTPDGILVVDGEGKQILQNPKFREVIGLPTEVADEPDDSRMLRSALRLVANPDAFMERIGHLYAHPSECGWDEIVFEDGRIVERYSSPVVDDGGTSFGRIWTFRDVTERKRNEVALRESEARLRRLYASIRDAYAAVGMDGRFIDVNDAFANMLGYEKVELIGRGFNDITPARWRAAGDGPVRAQVLALGYSDVFEKEYERKDGTVFPVELRIFLQRDAAGAPASMWALVRDITQRKREEAELRESEEKFSVAFYRSPVMMSIARATDGCYLDVNHAFELHTGYSRDEVIGRTRREVGLWASAADLESAVRAFRERGQFGPMRTPCRLKSGEMSTLSISGAAIDLAGEACVLAVAEDITERVRAESAVRALTADLEQRVLDRTAELMNANLALQTRTDELEMFNRAMIGREKRVIELKEEVNQLCARLRLAPAYEPVWRVTGRE
jgi:PAS domain S-box-containing protein